MSDHVMYDMGRNLANPKQRLICCDGNIYTIPYREQDVYVKPCENCKDKLCDSCPVKDKADNQ